MPEGEIISGRKARRWTSYVSVVLELAMFAELFVISLFHYHDEFVPERINIALNCFGAFLLTIIDLGILRGGERERFNYEYRALIFCCVTYLFSDGIFWHAQDRPELWLVCVIMNLLYELLPVFMTVLFWRLLRSWIRDYTQLDRKMDRLMQIQSLIYGLLIVVGVLSGWIVNVDPKTGQHSRGPGYLLTVIYPTLMVAQVTFRILKSREKVSTKLMLLVYPLVPYVCLLIQWWTGIAVHSMQPLAMCSALVFHYTNVYVRVEQLTARREQALMESRLRTLQAQVNPHFIYNALSSVASLCDSDPAAAQEMVYRLSDYLHDHFSGMGQPSLIPFQEELDHLSHYIAIEQVRFPNIRMEYDLEETNFLLPRMTLQPLVENAIKHGICKRRKSAGTIRLSSRRTEEGCEIRIEDDGVGFDTVPEGTDHIGIANVRTRLKLLCDGSLTVTGRKGEGCTTRILIPACQHFAEML